VTTAPLSSHQLIIHLFAPTDGPDAADAYGCLTKVWQGCAIVLGMDQPVAELDLPASLPPEPAQSTGPVAACERPGPGVFQAVLIREPEVACLSVALAPDSGGDWRDLREMWHAAVGIPVPDGDRLLGVAYCYLALATVDPERQSVARAVRAELPPSPGTPLVWRAGAGTREGFVLWDAAGAPDTRRERTIAVVAPNGTDTRLSAWLWSPGTPDLAPFTRYLRTGAMLRYELRVWQDESRVVDLRLRADPVLEELLELVSGRRTGGQVSDEELHVADERLAELQARDAGLITTAYRLRMLQRAVQVANADLAAFREAHVRGQEPDGLFADEKDLGDWLERRLDDDREYVVAAQERVQQIAARVDKLLRRRVEQRREDGRRRQERATLLQAAVIGAVVMGLTAVQSLNYDVPLPGSVKPAAITALASITLYLAATVLRLAMPERRTPLHLLEHAATGLTLGSVLWFATGWIVRSAYGHVLSPRVTLPLMLTGLVVGGCASALLRLRRPRTS
jgi:hypothetical protein